ncbi:nucleotide sugar dehydrogenase [Desulfobulbus propionicus DSM 2032]|uniref:UDP-glucose 6-dehydrogenase n=1 Tax=Desulfobulbus propionicus (strain ATCC 33891 / DSM 2032 / VKM B-1956 / 1pr3) TaxID=577650 RepID=A0A7U4DPR2_DESPD|nr:UDP-glucose/GDP-mannose dehydrogenase family protein [Desulfobulbus propionicus]ADW18339.1 nucleotide sugar dehydrogenase [Desulfobulbus propionicus DSM 2032]
MNITMIGTGYVGLVTGTCFAEFGHIVTCVDNMEEKIMQLNQGIIPIYEPGLDVLVKKNTAEGRLRFTTDLAQAIPEADAVFIAVGTPSSRRGDGYADLTYIYAAARELAVQLRKYTVVVDKSTVPVGTARQVERIIRETNPQAEFDVASNPEFLREGAAISDFMRPDRIVIGVETERAGKVLKEIYKPLYLRDTPIVHTTIETAELTKYAANAFLAVKISFINEIAMVCESVNANVIDLAKAIGMDGRIGSKFLHPGPGYGGSCFPKDTLALMRIVQEHGENVRIVEAAVEVNAAQKARMVKKIREMLGGIEAGKTIAILGLTFKPETDDMRDAPSTTILPALIEKGARIRAHDPKGMEEAKKYLPAAIEYVDTPYEAATGADCIVLMTEWNQYRALDLRQLKTRMKTPIFIDLRNVYDPASMKEAGFQYTGVGRK